MPKIKDVRGTAFIVAEFRAEENEATNPLYHDPIASLFLNEESRRAAKRISDGLPALKEMVKIRTRYYDDKLSEQISSGRRQVLLLGSGLDTRPARKPALGVTYFEIDDSDTLALKRACYEARGIAAKVKFVPGDYVKDGVVDLLSKGDFDFNLPTYIVWEGNTMYLPKESNRAVMEDLESALREFSLSFDYMAEAIITKTTGNPELSRIVENFVNMGAPWITGFADVAAFARETKLQVIENFTTAELRRAYRPGQEPPTPIEFGEFYSVCTLEAERGSSSKTPVRDE